jgi:hypothetical protein
MVIPHGSTIDCPKCKTTQAWVRKDLRDLNNIKLNYLNFSDKSLAAKRSFRSFCCDVFWFDGLKIFTDSGWKGRDSRSE